MKNHRSWHRADQAEWECDCRPDALIRPLADEFPVFRLVRGPLQRRVQTVYDFAEKIRVSLKSTIYLKKSDPEMT
jgi:hypothetical protein